ncbi:MAG: helix-turn-helix transcriptional regulator [Opitutales bacterium]
MDSLSQFLYKTRMAFYRDLDLQGGDHIPACRAWIDQVMGPYFALNFAATGSVYFGYPGQPARWQPAPFAWYTRPGERVTYGIPPDRDATWNHTFVTFRGSLCRRWVADGLIPAAGCGQRLAFFRDPAAFHRALLLALDAFRSGGAEGHALAGNAIHEAWLRIHADRHVRPVADDSRQRVERLVKALQERPEPDRDWTYEAGRIALSASQLRRIFRAVTGASPAQFQQQLRLQRAADLLRGTVQPIEVIAAQVGYPDSYYFNRLFRRRFGLPPGRYRQRQRVLPGGSIQEAAGDSVRRTPL